MLFTLLAADPTPDTSGYMIAGYKVIFGIMLIYLISLIVRARNTKRNLNMLQDLEIQEEKKSQKKEEQLTPEKGTQ